MDTRSVAHSGHDLRPNTHETPHGCINGAVYIGHMLEDDSGEELEVFEAVACRRCNVDEGL